MSCLFCLLVLLLIFSCGSWDLSCLLDMCLSYFPWTRPTSHPKLLLFQPPPPRRLEPSPCKLPGLKRGASYSRSRHSFRWVPVTPWTAGIFRKTQSRCIGEETYPILEVLEKGLFRLGLWILLRHDRSKGVKDDRTWQFPGLKAAEHFGTLNSMTWILRKKTHDADGKKFQTNLLPKGWWKMMNPMGSQFVKNHPTETKSKSRAL